MGLLSRWRRINPGAPLRRVMWWKFLRFLTEVYLRVKYRHRAWHTERVPKEGGVLMVCNHQSVLDLMVVGVGLHHRHFHSMARKTLFDKRSMAWLIRSLNGFPVDQSKGDLGAMRAAIEKLKAGHLVLVFPEGSRTPDGAVHEFRAGVLTLIRRSGASVVPAAVDGVFEVWPIGQKKPRKRGRTGAIYGEPLDGAALAAMEPKEALEVMRKRVDELRVELRGKLRAASGGKYPARDAADGSEIPRPVRDLSPDSVKPG